MVNVQLLTIRFYTGPSCERHGKLGKTVASTYQTYSSKYCRQYLGNACLRRSICGIRDLDHMPDMLGVGDAGRPVHDQENQLIRLPVDT